MKPLSEREIGECMVAVSDPLQWGVLKGNGAHVREFVRAIEAKLASREEVQAEPSDDLDDRAESFAGSRLGRCLR